MTLTEVLVVIVVLAVVVVVLFSAFISDNPRDPRYFRINCVNNLKEIGLAYLIWAEDNNGKYPMELSVTNGGTKELAVAGNVVATFQIMSNELNTPILLCCPADSEHNPATNFSFGFSSKNISYFTGLDAATNSPHAVLSGDDNFEIGDATVSSGVLKLSTNTSIAWTAARHKQIRGEHRSC